MFLFSICSILQNHAFIQTVSKFASSRKLVCVVCEKGETVCLPNELQSEHSVDEFIMVFSHARTTFLRQPVLIFKKWPRCSSICIYFTTTEIWFITTYKKAPLMRKDAVLPRDQGCTMYPLFCNLVLFFSIVQNDNPVLRKISIW